MIVFSFTKIDGAEYISHLDTLRHIIRTLKRAQIDVNISQAVNKHPRIFLSAPLGVGMKSISEYCLLETDYKDSADNNFKDLFNAYSPLGIKCVNYAYCDKKLAVANAESFTYEIFGINFFEVNEFLNRESLILTDKRGRTGDVLHKIIDLYFENDKLIATLKAGKETLRPDDLSEKLVELFGGRVQNIIKIKANGIEGLEI